MCVGGGMWEDIRPRLRVVRVGGKGVRGKNRVKHERSRRMND